jgi:hypothetical protein
MHRSFAKLIALIASMALAPHVAAQQSSGRILGHIDRVLVDDGGAHVRGWACQEGRPESIEVHLYADASAQGQPKETLAANGKADLDNEAAVDAVCKDPQGHKHRFDIPIAGATLLKVHGAKLVAHGIRVAGNAPNSAINGSGAFTFPDAPSVRRFPAVYARVPGEYRPLNAHPRVFNTRAELEDIAKRAGVAQSYTASRYRALADRVRSDIAAKVDWQSIYSGCDVEIYLRAFSFEPKPAYGNDRSEDDLRAALHGKPGLAPPHGAAIVADRAALYAALLNAGAPVLPGEPSSADAAAFSKGIVLAWADHGFRDETGAFRRSDEKYCDLDPAGKPIVTQFGTFIGALNLSRGVIYSVHAQDLLEGMGAVSLAEQQQMDAFHRNMLATIRSINNAEYDINMKWRYSDEVYNNQFAGHLTAMLSLARLVDDRKSFEAALDGGSGEAAVKLPWIELFDHVIYGENDTPLLNITPNSAVDPLQNHSAYSTAVVAPGEINDRFRHANALQSFGYATGSLEGLYMAAEVLKIAGFDPYAYRASHGQSLEMATAYYGCFAKSAGFDQIVTKENSSRCANVRQYLGSIVNGVAPTVLAGAYRFPGNADLVSLDAAAKVSYLKSPFSIEPIMFGKWRD